MEFTYTHLDVQYWPIPPDNEITNKKIPHFRVQFKKRMPKPKGFNSNKAVRWAMAPSMELAALGERWRKPTRFGGASRRAWIISIGCAICLAMLPGSIQAVELCSPEAQKRMIAVGITKGQIDALCSQAAKRGKLLSISIQRAEDELGYCRVTLALRNNSVHYVNVLSLTTAGGRFDIFQFNAILPGETGYASGKSRSLLACDELNEVTVAFLWPGSIRVDDSPLQGRRLRQFKPALESPELQWSR